MKNTLIRLTFVTIILFAYCITANAFVVYMSFPEMIANADNIGYYSATQTNDSNEFKLDLLHNLKGDSCSSLYINNENNNIKSKLASSNEPFLMFIKKDIKSEKNSLIGIFGNQELLTEYSLYNKASMVEMESIIKIISDLHKVELAQRITDICKLFESEKPLERFTALDYSESQLFRKSIAQDKRADVSRDISAFAISLINDKEPEIRRHVVSLLFYAPYNVILSIAPKYLEDSDRICRQFAKNAINSAISQNRVINPILNDFGSRKDDKKLDDYNMDEIQNECKKVLESRPDIKEKDIKYLDKWIKEGKITKQSADIFKSYMK